MSVGDLGLFGRQFQDVCPYHFLDEARQVAFSTTTLTGQKPAKGLVGVGRDNDIPANGVHGALRV